MAQVPKLISISQSPAALANNRVAAGNRVASVLEGPIDQISGGGAVSIDANAAGFDERQDVEEALRHQTRDRERRGSAFANGRLFTANSSVFASILERPDEPRTSSEGPIGPRRDSESVSKIISTYETNAKVITGTNPILGTELSISL